jgi:hypothetical protein
MSYRTPFINVWNPICKRYQWLRTINIFSFNNNYVYVACMTENNQCKCLINKYLVVPDSLVFRASHPQNNWVNKVKTWPEPELGVKNVYTNKYMGIDMIDIYKKIKLNYPKYVRIDEPKLDCYHKNQMK